MIADITPLEDRNKYYSRLEALTSAAFILGPALAGILAGIFDAHAHKVYQAKQMRDTAKIDLVTQEQVNA